MSNTSEKTGARKPTLMIRLPSDRQVARVDHSQGRTFWPGGTHRHCQGQVFLLAVIVIAQLWLITDALYELLSGRIASLGWLALASGLAFALALVITLWPRRRIEEP